VGLVCARAGRLVFASSAHRAGCQASLLPTSFCLRLLVSEVLCWDASHEERGRSLLLPGCVCQATDPLHVPGNLVDSVPCSRPRLAAAEGRARAWTRPLRAPGSPVLSRGLLCAVQPRRGGAQVRNWYVDSFKELRRFPQVKDTADELHFTELLKHIYHRHRCAAWRCLLGGRRVARLPCRGLARHPVPCESKNVNRNREGAACGGCQRACYCPCMIGPV